MGIEETWDATIQGKDVARDLKLLAEEFGDFFSGDEYVEFMKILVESRKHADQMALARYQFDKQFAAQLAQIGWSEKRFKAFREGQFDVDQNNQPSVRVSQGQVPTPNRPTPPKDKIRSEPVDIALGGAVIDTTGGEDEEDTEFVNDEGDEAGDNNPFTTGW